jgi:hypothetical protein
MRDLVKGSYRVAEVQTSGTKPARSRLRPVLALAFLALGCFYYVQYLRLGSAPGLAGLEAVRDAEGPAWFSTISWHVRSLSRQVQSAVNGALPSGPLVAILKMALCAVAAAAFLRGPSRS